MTTTNVRRLLAALILPLFLLTVGCDSMTEIEGDAGKAVEENVTIEFMQTPSGLQFSATGAIEDEGSVEGAIMPVEDIPTEAVMYGRRTLWSKFSHRSIVVEYQGQLTAENPRVVEGTFRILGGTGIYTNVQGSGDCRVFIDDGVHREVFSGRATY